MMQICTSSKEQAFIALCEATTIAMAAILEECAKKHGISAEDSKTLGTQTVIGAAAMLESFPEKSPQELGAEVASPGGTTEAAMSVLRAGDGDLLGDILARAFKAAEEAR